MISIFLADEQELPGALREWSERWGWVVTHELAEGLQLEWRDSVLSLHQRNKKLPAVVIDFIELWRTTRINSQDPFAKALGLKKGLRHVVDATTGLGGDLIKLLKLNCQVVAVEESPVIFALLQDAWRRADLDERWVKGGGARARLVFGAAEDALPQLSAQEREVIFLDPMYPEKNKKALSKGEMQVLQDLFEGDQTLSEDETFAAHLAATERLWQAAMVHATQRVVLKRPRRAAAWAKAPIHSFEGQSTRYDIWSP